ncbi:MAG: RNA polymerase sporulation sigma factor SigF [Lachnospiraceae bacterium]|nr:RNA polymerase sporulation sigma factor SigF [Lachnospiraceae bacterium]
MDSTLLLIQRVKGGDEEAKAQLVKENEGLVWSVVKRFFSRGQDPEDLFQIGCIGLLKSIDKFDFSYNVKFSTYAVPMIMGELKRFLRDDGMIKVSRTLKEANYKIKQEITRLQNELNREPTLDEIAKRMEMEPEEVAMAMESGMELESIYQTIYQSDGSDVYLIDKIKNEEDESEKLIEKVALMESLNHLEAREQELIRMRYFEEKTQAQIAKKFGISQVQVSRLEKKILATLRNYWTK